MGMSKPQSHVIASVLPSAIFIANVWLASDLPHTPPLYFVVYTVLCRVAVVQ